MSYPMVSMGRARPQYEEEYGTECTYSWRVNIGPLILGYCRHDSLLVVRISVHISTRSVEETSCSSGRLITTGLGQTRSKYDSFTARGTWWSPKRIVPSTA